MNNLNHLVKQDHIFKNQDMTIIPEEVRPHIASKKDSFTLKTVRKPGNQDQRAK